MKFVMPLLIPFLLLTFSGCTPEESVTASPGSFSGRWQVQETASIFYTGDVEIDRQIQSGKPGEFYHFAQNGHFTFHQQDSTFAMQGQGQWHLSKQHDLVTLVPTESDTIRWKIDYVDANRLLISCENAVSVNGHWQRIKVVTSCVR